MCDHVRDAYGREFSCLDTDEKPHSSSQTSNDSIKAKLACLAILARDMSDKLTFSPNQARDYVGIERLQTLAPENFYVI